MTASTVDGTLELPGDIKIPDVYDKNAYLGLYGLQNVAHLSVTCDGKTSVISLDSANMTTLINALAEVQAGLRPSEEVAR